MKAALEFHKVTFAFDERVLLREADFSIQSCEAVALLGPNGAGKTTLLRLAAGLLIPAAGEVLLGGKPLASLSRMERARQIALVPQRLEMPFAFTVQQLVEQGRSPHLGWLGTATRADREAVERAFELTGTGVFRKRIFNELSGGERQRVKIALGLAQQPKLLLLDEPAQSLDVGWQRELLGMVSGLRRHGVTVLAAVHELHLVAEYFSRVLLLAPGEAMLGGSSGNVLASEELHRAFYPASRLPRSISTERVSDE